MKPGAPYRGQIVRHPGMYWTGEFKVLSVQGPFRGGAEYICELEPHPNPFGEESFTYPWSLLRPVVDGAPA